MHSLKITHHPLKISDLAPDLIRRPPVVANAAGHQRVAQDLVKWFP
jgi:hypothetical protein